ncbi:antibiotic biosynthesis monooxygenase [Cryobacterium sp. TMT1-21]|uniref:Antibiotic biosynthesis monooxygenase n=1 Tax=Cryobacterium shii TaxID=1259235 RepID=A0AAQ2C7U7_9MICO|nr:MULTISPECIES: antibiotic biosynthesis monooxygenase family protein [Cryobacterium]TFC50812.1 antibiotic biosynthesis monooxygenase [Cryobacterium shii]TFD17188.1 antibiotic biosynthesis monooxygenase [Cryobacterium sp. TMT1-21]TFD26400.1 antibiotic biosynthesis monooxygenase [Cryobacterium sp. TMT2-23]TFD40626.1 antibiotic biosynthesis monooxygenase [Cryobacterium sp. TMT2-10]
MILEHAFFSVLAGPKVEFEAAFNQARPLIGGQPGFRSLSLSRSMGSPNLYDLLADWDSVKAQTRGFQRRATHVAG